MATKPQSNALPRVLKYLGQEYTVHASSFDTDYEALESDAGRRCHYMVQDICSETDFLHRLSALERTRSDCRNLDGPMNHAIPRLEEEIFLDLRTRPFKMKILPSGALA